jgi:hypothetical protein
VYASGFFGRAVDISANGDTIVAGGSGANSNRGYVRVYTKVRSLSFKVHFESYTTSSPFQNTASTWSLHGNEIQGGNIGTPLAGCAVSMSALGDRIAFGAKGDNNNLGYSAVYELVGSTWTLRTQLYGSTFNMQLGSSVSLSPNGLVFATGVPYYNNYGGGVIVKEQASLANPSVWLEDNILAGPANSYSGTDVAVTDSALVGTYC